MCCCKKPHVNGEPGLYSWDGKSYMTRQPSPPELQESDTLLLDLPGRCGRRQDSHCHHFRLVDNYGSKQLLTRNGSGDHRMRLSRPAAEVIAGLDHDSAYWVCAGLYHAHSEAERNGITDEAERWRRAAAEKRIKVRKVRGRDAVRVSIDPPTIPG